jgi:hypothetical protein
VFHSREVFVVGRCFLLWRVGSPGVPFSVDCVNNSMAYGAFTSPCPRGGFHRPCCNLMGYASRFWIDFATKQVNGFHACTHGPHTAHARACACRKWGKDEGFCCCLCLCVSVLFACVCVCVYTYMSVCVCVCVHVQTQSLSVFQGRPDDFCRRLAGGSVRGFG